MRFIKIIFILFSACLLVPTATAFAQWTANNMMLVKLIPEVEASPDGKKIAYIVLRHIKIDNAWQNDSQIFLTDRETHKTYPLTHEKNEIDSFAWSPDGSGLAYITQANNGSGLKIIRLHDRKIETLIRTKSLITELKWSPDGTRIAYLKNDTIPQPILPQPIVFRFTNLLLNNLWMIHLNSEKKLTDKPEQITHYSRKDAPGIISSIDWSSDSTHLLFIRFSPQTDAYWSTGTLIVMNLKNKKSHLLLNAKMIQHCPHFSPDGQQIAFLSASRVYIVPAQGGTPKPLALTPDQLPLSIIGWSADGTHVYVQEYFHTYGSLLSLSTDGKHVKMINPKNKFIKDITLNTTHTLFGFSMEDSDHPEEAYISETKLFKPIRISHVNTMSPLFPLGVTKIIHWHSTDGTIIEGLLTYPVHYQKGKRYPLLVENHGGPGFVFQQYYIARLSVYPIAVFASQGYLYFRPNIRGSSGYGPAFRNGNYKDWGGADYQDMISGIDHLIDLGIADPNRLGILGWSFGGYMGAWAVTQTHRFKAAALGGAITDLISYAGTVDLAHFIPNSLGNYFWNDSKLYLERSPIMHVKNVKTPVLFLNGQLDYRVPPTQSEEFYRALILLGIPSELILYPNTYHPIRIPYLVVDAAKRNIAWMNKYIKGNSSAKRRGLNNAQMF